MLFNPRPDEMKMANPAKHQQQQYYEERYSDEVADEAEDEDFMQM